MIDLPPVIDEPPVWPSGHPDPHPFYAPGGLGDYTGDHPVNIYAISELMTQVESYVVLVVMAGLTLTFTAIMYKLAAKWIRRLNRI